MTLSFYVNTVWTKVESTLYLALSQSKTIDGGYVVALAFMEHFLILSEDIAATRDWYVGVLGMKLGPWPDVLPAGS